MSNVKVKLNYKGFNELRKDASIIGLCGQKANEAVSKLGEGYDAKKVSYSNRDGYIVKATTVKAAKDNLDNNSLAKAVLGG